MNEKALSNRLNLNSAQLRFSELADTTPALAVSNVTTAFWMQARFCHDALLKAVTSLSTRHAMLRAAVAGDGGNRYFELSEDVVSFSIHEVKSQADVVNCCRTLANDLHGSVLSVRRCPMWSIQVIRSGDQIEAFILSINHLIADGWSARIFAVDFGTLYAAALNGAGAALPILATETDYKAREEQELMSSSEGAVRLDRYVTNFQGLEWEASPKQHAGALNRIEIEFTPNLWASVLVCAKRRGLRVSSVFTYALMLAERELYGKTEFRLKTVVANRSSVASSGMINCLINLLPMNLRMPGKSDRCDAIRDVQHQYENFEVAELPYWEVVRRVAPQAYLHPYGLCDLEVNVYRVQEPVILDLPDVNIRRMVEVRTDAPAWPHFKRCLQVQPRSAGGGILALLYDDLHTTQDQAAEEAVQIRVNVERTVELLS